MTIKKHVPNSLTALNLISGMAGIYFVLEGQITFGAYFIFAAAFFDFFDGFAARLLNVSGEMGKQMDSLADLVTFGVLPSFIIFKMLESSSPEPYLPFIGFAIGVMSAFRLAKFNIDTRQTDRFIGVPTPATALLLSTLPFLAEKSETASNVIYNPVFLVVLTLVMSYLLVAELPLIALKFKSFGLEGNVFRYLVILIAVASLLFAGLAGIPFIIISYIVLSMIERLVKSDGKI
ncbi:CDP-diacylglycerol--serine O-phosphatidyltransferase [Litoribacter alkaliphilus]|uniref:CDP-diacylglycerol--serine O-phosphatidyltransferase n=1 Tax=Litoribacter ruber TaxID=702568 RepID=A0AAP2G0U5_9BACT|nr:CDP-diacylglycerol--serine O-phosphatidyltransferase [Litoribacter alkaliphilus]MBS9522952.1 CDP-diacylglycerol--serine O-phosphatidyltransferase [Litoribacter alkaliphilus]